MRSSDWYALLILLLLSVTVRSTCAESPDASDPSLEEQHRLTLDWADNLLSVRRAHLPGGVLKIQYLEAFCRPGSTDRDWAQTVIDHTTQQVSADEAGQRIKLVSRLADGVLVEHVITAGGDEVDFRLTARNPTDKASEAHWAQPCIRVEAFTGTSPADRLKVYPPYIRKCFIFLEGKLARLPTEPWATAARYRPGQVYCPADVPRGDVNPRPLSRLVPSNGLIGCFSEDEKQILATAWQPYQELFQGVVGCIHSDFRIGGLEPHQTKTIRGKLYLVPADVEALLARYREDFPEQAGAVH